MRGQVFVDAVGAVGETKGKGRAGCEPVETYKGFDLADGRFETPIPETPLLYRGVP